MSAKTIYDRIIVASNAWYNDGLAKAGVRNLSGAVESLKISLRFYKMNTDARNLLGLVYFEMGETVEALTEWVISKNYKPQDNLASKYLDEIQSNQGRLDTINQTIKKYNQALLYCRQNSRDLAIIQLKKVLSLNPRLVSGHQLLALLYLQEGKYELAKKSLRNAGKIDTNNTVTMRYMKEVNQALRENTSGKKAKKEDQISYQSGNETIIQPKYLKETSVFGTIVNMLIGIAIGVAITWFLVVPSVKRDIQNEAKTEVLEANNTISAKNQTISSLEAQIEELNSQIEAAKTDGEESDSRLESYDWLLKAYNAYVKQDFDGARTILAKVNADYLGSDAKSVYDTITTGVDEEYMESLYQSGYTAYTQGDYAKATEELQKVVDADENYDGGNALFYLAQAYNKGGELETALPLYARFVELYPGTERAATSQSALDAAAAE
ncbi:MAG: tetratricopeptide repeat protein [Roseburia sp.]